MIVPKLVQELPPISPIKLMTHIRPEYDIDLTVQSFSKIE